VPIGHVVMMESAMILTMTIYVYAKLGPQERTANKQVWHTLYTLANIMLSG
jgi:hypothetical protein